ncbi:MAG: nuclear transport factor 2 family protein [Actinobacteria bacterium]|jgi:ketosteroid isomerase-like protein|nr:nuclear transport factor 2 family protein [Actinomycetota bacterium]MCA1740419.1 nuclear transport factor 2 family protein [Actinomycetota bacterium]
MAEQQVSGKLDFEDLRRAQERRDLDAMLNLYADDAEIHIVNRNTPPSSPYVLRGKEAIAEYLRDVFGREMSHTIENEVVGEDRLAFNVACEYPEGTRVLASENMEVRNGKVVRQVEVVAWDEE